MQAVGAILGSVVICYMAVMTAQLRRQGARERKQGELSLQLLRQQIEAASLLRTQREQEQLCWNGYRKFVVQSKVQEADNVYSFYLFPHDCKPLPLFRPGQFLTFRLDVPGIEKPVVRCYSISNHPNPHYFRITVKRVPGGMVSNHLIDAVDEGAILDVQAPRGEFRMDVHEQRPAVLIAGGVGVTPFVSMLGAVAGAKSGREVTLVYGVRNGREHAFASWLKELIATCENIRVVTVYSEPSETDEAAGGFDYAGFVNAELLKSVLPSNNFDFYLCGPPPMMNSVMDELRGWGVPATSIRTEAFGAPSARVIGSQKDGEAPSDATEAAETKTNGTHPGKAASTVKAIAAKLTAKKAPSVRFSRTGRTVRWEESCGSLLGLAASNGVGIESACGAGNCGSCQTAVRSGKVRYPDPPGFPCEDRTCLPCVAVPDGDVVLDA